MAGSYQHDEDLNRKGWFATTHWSVVLAAGETSSPRAEEALETLCRAYWPPLYSFLRRLGHSPADAQDLTQAFLTNLLARGSFRNLSPQKGRFRSYLLTSLKYFLADEWDKARAQKRGGGMPLISLDAQEAEDRYTMEPVDENDPERIFERRWALTLLDRTLALLETEMKEAGKHALWRELKECLLTSPDGSPYSDIAERLGLTLSAVKMTVSRLRCRFGELLRSEIAQTVHSDSEVDEEMRYLLTVMRR